MDPKNIDRVAKAVVTAVVAAGYVVVKKSPPFLKKVGKTAIKTIFKRRR